MQNTGIQLFYFERDRKFYFSYIAITRNYNNTNYTENMMIVLLDDKTKQTDIYFLFFIYFIVLF